MPHSHSPTMLQAHISHHALHTPCSTQTKPLTQPMTPALLFMFPSHTGHLVPTISNSAYFCPNHCLCSSPPHFLIHRFSFPHSSILTLPAVHVCMLLFTMSTHFCLSLLKRLILFNVTGFHFRVLE